MNRRVALSLFAVLACAAPRVKSPPFDDPGVVDLHVDLPYALHARHTSLDASQASPKRVAAGGVRLLVTPLFVEGAWSMSPAAVRSAYAATFDDLRAALPKLSATTGVALSFEGADGFAGDESAIDEWMARGACLVGLVHDHSNSLGGASQDPDRGARARGLSDAGKALAAHVVARGGLLDVAHASDATFDDLAAIARRGHAPLVDSHTGMRALRDVMRDLDDARARTIAESGGVIGISMHGGHVGREPGQPPSLSDVAAHIARAVEVAGASHVAIGSDFDGGIDPPREVDGEASWPLLREELLARGLSPATVDAIFGGNALRVFDWARAHGCAPGARKQGRAVAAKMMTECRTRESSDSSENRVDVR